MHPIPAPSPTASNRWSRLDAETGDVSWEFQNDLGYPPLVNRESAFFVVDIDSDSVVALTTA